MSRKKPVASASLYSVHPGVAMVQNWVATLKDKTGRTLEQWIALVDRSGPPQTKDRRQWLKEKYNLGTNSAWWIVERAEGKGEPWEGDPDAYLEMAPRYVEEMFASKPALRPLYDKLLRIGLDLGPDVKACPCKTIVPLYRNHVFAELKPSTKTRLDLSFALKGTEPTGRLLATGGAAKGDRLTHRIPILCDADLDDEVKDWLRTAYERDA
jgi:hypothetical protein